MRKLQSNSVGIAQGSTVLFQDFKHDGVMWTGTGPRSIRYEILFDEAFRSPPAVTVGISMWDIDQNTNQRADISAENVTAGGFHIVFNTWGDTRVARVRADWMAIGEARHDDDWDLY